MTLTYWHPDHEHFSDHDGVHMQNQHSFIVEQKKCQTEHITMLNLHDSRLFKKMYMPMQLEQVLQTTH